MERYDLIVVGSGAAGLIAAITAARRGKKVLILEKLSRPGAKLKATGGGRCNLTNTLPNETFMEHFGRNGRFMRPALSRFDHTVLREFFDELGVQTHAPDGFRIFPKTHNAQTILTALLEELKRLDIKLLCNRKVETILTKNDRVDALSTVEGTFYTDNIVLATGGKGYPMLGAEGDGYAMAKRLGHKVTPLYPAMMPLKIKERWGAACRADTIAKATIKVDLPKAKKLQATGDLIFTKDGIRGPVVLDFSREITPLLQKYTEVPLLVNMTKGMHADAILHHLKKEASRHPDASIQKDLTTLLPSSVAEALCKECGIDPNIPFCKIPGTKKDQLMRILAWTPLTVIGHEGFKTAMITRGGISLKEIDPNTMESKRVKGLYFCGEIVDLDGPCGGYNLQWSFASGHLAGHLSEVKN
jgi:predicted Rossmann fold flavoprotein